MSLSFSIRPVNRIFNLAAVFGTMPTEEVWSMAKRGARDLGKEAAWRQRITRQAASGLSGRAWCRKHNVTEATFYWWRRELARRDTEQPPAAKPDAPGQTVPLPNQDRQTAPLPNQDRRTASFIPVRVLDASEPGDPPIEIVLADGRCVRVTSPVNRQTLADVLDILERRAC